MKKQSAMYHILLWCFLSLAGPALLGAEIMVFAAASLTEALQEIARNYSATNSNKVVFNFAASSVLARQIQEGARADLFISADEAKIESLEKKGLVMEGTRRNLLSNALVIITEKGSDLKVSGPADLKKARRVAIAEPNTVPAGIYARQYLEEAGVWPELSILPTDNVRGALAAVESGNAQAALVYKTDVRVSEKVQVVFEVPATAGLNIVYPLVRLKEARQPDASESFWNYLQSHAAAAVFKQHGFVVLENSDADGGLK